MNLQGRRIHIAGSADVEADEKKLTYVHSLVSELTTVLAGEGASFVIPFGSEPLLKERTDGPSIIFDWTVAEAVCTALRNGKAKSTGSNGRLVQTISTSKTESKIPEKRRGIYDELRKKDAVNMEFLEPGWTAGALNRTRLAQLGDILIAISGGQGVEQLAIEYSTKGKIVIPLDINVGSSSHDGSGGAVRLFDRARVKPADFFKVIDGQSASDLLDQTKTCNGDVAVSDVVAAIIKLLHALTSPNVFYVRLLDDTLPEYASAERFFRHTVDPLVAELGYQPFEMGKGKNEFAWMNQAIFDNLHHSSVVLVDLTGLRNNCFMELGYAFGNKQRVIVTAREDAKMPFDIAPFERFLWKESEDSEKSIERFRTFWGRNINAPALASPKEAK